MSEKYEFEVSFISNRIKEAYDLYSDIENLKIFQKSEYDLVTTVDTKIERYLYKCIKEMFPNDNILAEETCSNTKFENRTWVIDPLDGTCNFSQNLPLYAVQCALVENMEIVLGVIYNPMLNELYTAVKGKGCFLNGVQIFVKQDIKINNAIISFGDYSHDSIKQNVFQHSIIGKLYPNVAKIRFFGSAAIDFSFVASNKIHATIMKLKTVWDVLPGILICKESGCNVYNIYGGEYKIGDDGVIITCNDELSKFIFDAVLSKELHFFYDNHIGGCIFDFDGIIVDTETYHLKAYNEALAMLNINISITEKEYGPLKSTGKEHILNFILEKSNFSLSEIQLEEIYTSKKNIYKMMVSNMSEKDILPGVIELLKLLYDFAIPTAVASSGSHTLELIKKLKLEQFFDVIIDGTMPYRKKPSPDIFLAASNLLDIDISRCVIFEDSYAGVSAGVAAGCDKIIAVGGIESDEAYCCVKSISDLIFVETMRD